MGRRRVLEDIEIVQPIVVLEDLALDLRGVHPGDVVLEFATKSQVSKSFCV